MSGKKKQHVIALTDQEWESMIESLNNSPPKKPGEEGYRSKESIERAHKLGDAFLKGLQAQADPDHEYFEK
jgi:hypothetical protein